MLTYKGKYNSANVFVDEIDEETVKQIYSFLNHPAFVKSYIAIMPDTHAGKGAVIGFTMPLNDYVIPNVVGVDLGCGIELYKLKGIKNIDRIEFDKYVKATIPVGYRKRNVSIAKTILQIDTPNFLYTALHSEKILQTIIDTNQCASDVLHSIGTLGGGNHFIEIDKTDTGEFWLAIHSGSRNFGKKVAEYHQNKAKELMKEMFVGDAYKQLEFLPIEYGGQEYLNDMHVAQYYAALNRYHIAKDLLNYFGLVPETECIKSVHNFIDPKDNIIRKGAIAAYEGQRLVIPLNAKDGIIIGIGKGSKKWNYSAPHGAGRVMSRTKAKATLSVDKYKKDMKDADIYTTTANQSTLDECWEAYKKKQLILDSINETVEVECIVKPIYSFKAGDNDENT